MSWLYSRALVEEYSAACCSDGGQCAPLRSIPTAPAYSCNGKMTGFSRLSRFGMTCELLMDDLGAGLLTWFREVSRVRISALPEKVQGLLESVRVSGKRCSESFAKYDLDTHSWRTYLLLFPEDSAPYSGTWPRSGTMRNGACWERTTAERRIIGNEFGYWRTPTAGEADHGGPNARDKSGALHLSAQVMAKMFPSPVASGKLNGGTRDFEKLKAMKEAGEITEEERKSMSAGNGGSLNPVWVELLMGWPANWSSLSFLSMEEFNVWLEGFSEQDMRGVREVVRQEKSSERKTRRGSRVFKKEILQPVVCEYEMQPHKARIQLESSQAFEEGMRGVQLQQETSSASSRSRHNKQQSGEHPDTLQTLPRLLAHYGKEAWQDGSWENAVSRTVEKVAARVDRLRAIGNGQVPLVAATAWRILIAMIEGGE